MNKPKQHLKLSLINRAIVHTERTAIRESGFDYSYSDILLLSEEFALQMLTEKSDLNEARVAYFIPTSLDYVVVQWAIWRAGGIAVPLSQSGADRELEYVLEDCDVDTVVTTSVNYERLSKLCSPRNIDVICYERPEQIESNPDILPLVTPDRRALILYTSGTTSQPKGVVLTHEAIESQAFGLVSAWQWTEEDCIPLFLPLHHIHGIVNVLCCALWSGAQVELFPKFEMESLVNRVATNAYSVFMAVPTVYREVD